MSKSDDLSRQQSKLSPAKRALLDQWLKGGHAAETRIIPRRSEDDTAPLSFAQQRLWFLEQFEPGTATYHLSSALRLTGSLSIAALRRAFNEVLRRHEVLRACFPSSGGLPIQRINPHDQAALSVYDLSELGERWREAEAKRLTSQEAVRLFDLARGPLFRAALLRLSPRRHLLLLTMHHIVSDGWSMGVLVGELTTLYSAFARGAPSPLAELPIQYADYARWQRRYLRGEVLERQLSYWRAQLAGAPPLLELPADRARPAARSFRGASCRVEFDAGLTRRLRELSHGEGATLHMTLLAGFQLLLSRYAGQREVVVGTPVAGRTRAEVEGLVGMFVNTVALRTELGEGLTFRGLVARVRGVCVGAYAHQEVACERVVEELRPGREGGRTPLF